MIVRYAILRDVSPHRATVVRTLEVDGDATPMCGRGHTVAMVDTATMPVAGERVWIRKPYAIAIHGLRVVGRE